MLNERPEYEENEYQNENVARSIVFEKKLCTVGSLLFSASKKNGAPLKYTAGHKFRPGWLITLTNRYQYYFLP